MTTPRPDTQIPSTAPAPQAPTPGPARPAPAPGLTAPAPQAPAGPASSSAPPDGRTRYANGERRRAELVDAARRVFAEQGFQRLSVRQIAAAIGTSHTMLLHHFGSKDALLEAVLTRREEMEAAQREVAVAERGLLDSLPDIMAHNASIRGLIQLDATLRAEAVSPQHAAHAYMTELGERFLAAVRTAVVRDQAAGRIRADVDPDLTARQLTALIEGVQVRWLYDEAVDMAAVVGAYANLLRP